MLRINIKDEGDRPKSERFKFKHIVTKMVISQKVNAFLFSSFLRRQESRKFKYFWTPALAGVTVFRTFYESIKKYF